MLSACTKARVEGSKEKRTPGVANMPTTPWYVRENESGDEKIHLITGKKVGIQLHRTLKSQTRGHVGGRDLVVTMHVIKVFAQVYVPCVSSLGRVPLARS